MQHVCITGGLVSLSGQVWTCVCVRERNLTFNLSLHTQTKAHTGEHTDAGSSSVTNLESNQTHHCKYFDFIQNN